MKTATLALALTSALLMSSNTYAVEHQSNCDIDINGAIDISQSTLIFYQHEKEQYQIKADNSLWINQKQIMLSPAQQKLVADYATQIHQMVPKVKHIADEGIMLAKEGISLAFNELLGPNHELTQNLVNQLDQVKTHINERFSSDHRLYIDSNGLKDDEFFDKDFENKLEKTIEDTVQQSMGAIMMAIGKKMMMAGSGEDFEQTMERFSENLETQIEQKASVLEQKADQLCLDAVSIDQLEQQLQQNITSLQGIDILKVSYQASQHKLM
jgi:hypothetical protein